MQVAEDAEDEEPDHPDDDGEREQALEHGGETPPRPGHAKIRTADGPLEPVGGDASSFAVAASRVSAGHGAGSPSAARSARLRVAVATCAC